MGQIQINRIHLVPLLWPHLYLFACFSFLNISITIVHIVMHVNHVCHRLKPFPSAGQPFTLCSSSSAADWRWLMGEFGLWSPLKPAHPFGCYCIVFEHFWTLMEGTVRLLVSEDISRCWNTFQGLLFDSSWLSQSVSMCHLNPFATTRWTKAFGVWSVFSLFHALLSQEGFLWQGGHVTAGAISSEIPFSSVLICSFLLFGCHPNAHFPSPPSDSWQCPMFLGFPASGPCLVPFNWKCLPELSARTPGEKRLLGKQQCHCEGLREDYNRVQILLFLCFLLTVVSWGGGSAQAECVQTSL